MRAFRGARCGSGGLGRYLTRILRVGGRAVDAVWLKVDLLDLRRVEHPREDRGLAPCKPFPAMTRGDRIRQTHRDRTGDVVGLSALGATDDRHRRDDT